MPDVVPFIGFYVVGGDTMKLAGARYGSLIAAPLLLATFSLGASGQVDGHEAANGNAPSKLSADCLRPGKGLYSMSAAQRETCHVQSYPRISTDRLKDGGHRYVYKVEGARTEYYVPPRSFDPQTASAAQLHRYGFKSRPGTRATPSVPANVKFLVPPPIIYVLPVPRSAPKHSTNWSGFEETGRGYTDVQSAWFQPALRSTPRCAHHSVVFWVGLGGDGTSKLAQDGTAKHTPGIANNYGWSEVLPQQKYMVQQKIHAPNGGKFYADTTYAGNNTFWFTMQDYKSNGRLYYKVKANGFSGRTAEEIAERPSVNGSLTNLSNFHPIKFRGSRVHRNGNQGIQLIHNFPRRRIFMHAGGRTWRRLLS